MSDNDASLNLNYSNGLKMRTDDDVNNTKKLAFISKKDPWQFTKKI